MFCILCYTPAMNTWKSSEEEESDLDKLQQEQMQVLRRDFHDFCTLYPTSWSNTHEVEALRDRIEQLLPELLSTARFCFLSSQISDPNYPTMAERVVERIRKRETSDGGFGKMNYAQDPVGDIQDHFAHIVFEFLDGE